MSGTGAGLYQLGPPPCGVRLSNSWPLWARRKWKASHKRNTPLTRGLRNAGKKNATRKITLAPVNLPPVSEV